MTAEGWELLEDQLQCLGDLAAVRYEENAEKGMSWADEEARWHIYKAIDQLAVASYHYRNGAYKLFEKNMADSLNHQIMAILTLGNDYEGCHPVMKHD